MALWEQVAYLADDAKRLLAFDALRSRIGTEAGAVARAGKPVLTKIAAPGGIFPELRAARMLRSAVIVQADFDGDLGHDVSVIVRPTRRVRGEMSVTLR